MSTGAVRAGDWPPPVCFRSMSAPPTRASRRCRACRPRGHAAPVFVKAFAATGRRRLRRGGRRAGRPARARRRGDPRGDPGRTGTCWCCRCCGRGRDSETVLGAVRARARPPAHGTTHPRFGWHRDNWLGRRRQINAWDDDGFAFFASTGCCGGSGEPRVEAALDPADRAALERLCHRLPDLLPDRPACLTHGDLWAQNVLATPDGQPALIDPAVSYMWAEVDLAHLWSTSPPPEAQRFFEVYAELTGLEAAGGPACRLSSCDNTSP